MNYPVIDFFKGIVKSVSADGLFIITLALIWCFFIVSLILTRRQESVYAENSAICFSVFSAFLITLSSAFYLVSEIPFYAFAFYFSVSATFSAVLVIPIKLAREKIKTRKQEKELVKYIDGQIAKENFSVRADKTAAESPLISNKRENIGVIKAVKPESSAENTAKSGDGVNFSHVKSVIDRLDYFDLSPADKKQIESLKSELYSAEKQGITPEKKSVINDGLSGLLKIMSKYGV